MRNVILRILIFRAVRRSHVKRIIRQQLAGDTVICSQLNISYHFYFILSQIYTRKYTRMFNEVSSVDPTVRKYCHRYLR